MIRPVPKPKHRRRKPRLSVRNNFSKKTMHEIYDRDNGLCQTCFRKGEEIHHIIFKSQGGRGVKENGILLCRDCHEKAHRNKKFADKLVIDAEEKYGKDFYKDEWDLM